MARTGHDGDSVRHKDDDDRLSFSRRDTRVTAARRFVFFELSGARAQPAASGDVVCWRGHAIHWGSRCARPARARPRASIACTFAHASVARRQQQCDAAAADGAVADGEGGGGGGGDDAYLTLAEVEGLLGDGDGEGGGDGDEGGGGERRPALGLPLARRLQLICRSLLLYSRWFEGDAASALPRAFWERVAEAAEAERGE